MKSITFKIPILTAIGNMILVAVKMGILNVIEFVNSSYMRIFILLYMDFNVKEFIICIFILFELFFTIPILFFEINNFFDLLIC